MYQVSYLPQGSTVYLHTSVFGKNQLIAGKVICTFVTMKSGHPCSLFVNTNFGVVKVQQGRCTHHLNISLDHPSSYSASCVIYNSVDEFHAGNVAKQQKSDARVDVYGLTNNGNTSKPCDSFYVCGYYVSGTDVSRRSMDIDSMLYDEANNRLVPAHSLYLAEKMDDNVAEFLSTPKTKREVLECIADSYCRGREVFATQEQARASLVGSVEVIGLDGSLIQDAPKQPTIKDKLLEFVDQQGTSLDMLRTLIDEMP